MRSSGAALGRFTGFAAMFVTLFLAGAGISYMDMKGWALVVFALAGVTILTIPMLWAVTLLILYMSVEGMMKLITHYHPVIHVGFDLLTILIALKWVVPYAFGLKKIEKPLPPQTLLLLFYIAWLLVEFFNPYSIGIIPSIAGMKVYSTWIVIFLFGYYLSRSKDDARHFIRLWVSIAVVQAVLSLYQGWIGPKSVLWISPMYAQALAKYQGYAFRPFGTTHLAGAPAIYIYPAIPLLLLLIFTARRFIWRPLGVTALPFFGMALALCQIRSAILKTIISSGVFIILAALRMPPKIRVRIVASVMVVAGVLSVALPSLTQQWIAANEENSMAVGRSASIFDWNTAKTARSGTMDRLRWISAEVPFGAGYAHGGAAAGAFEAQLANDPYYPGGFFADNFWVLTIGEIGIPGSAMLTLLMLSAMFIGFRSSFRITDPELNATGAALTSSLFAVFIGLWGGEGAVYNPESSFFWLYAGILMKLPQLDKELTLKELNA